MAHLVRYRSPEGEERYEDVADLDAAVERVEHLRNAEGVSDVRVYREVPLEFRTYVRVAVADDEAGSSSHPEPSSRPETGRATGGSVEASSRAGSSAEAPSGAAVISPPPASATPSSEDQRSAVQADASAPQADVEASAGENRRISLFNRGQAS